MRSPFAFSLRLALAACAAFGAAPALAQNVLTDPRFASGTSAWTLNVTPGVNSTLNWIQANGADGTAGYARLGGATLGPITFTAHTCGPVQPGVTYAFGGRLRFPVPQHAAANFWLFYYSDAACSVPIAVPPPFSSAASGASPGGWVPVVGTGSVAPAGAASAGLQINLFVVGTNEVGSLDFDDVFVGPAGSVEPLPLPALPPMGLAALGAALALAGALALRSPR